MAVPNYPNPEPRIPEWSLGDRLRKAREEAGYKQGDIAALLAQRLGIKCDRSKVAAWEGGTQPTQGVRMPQVITAWAELCHVDEAWLAGFRTGSFLTVLTNENPEPSGDDTPRPRLTSVK